MATFQLPAGFEGDEEDVRVFVVRLLGRPIGVTLVGNTVTLHNDVTPVELVRLDMAALKAQAKDRVDQAATVRANLQAFVDLQGPTNAQVVAVVKLLCRVALVLIDQGVTRQT